MTTLIATLTALPFSARMVLRILIAGLLAAPVGYEREQIHRNAGLRTHILVAIGSALVMCTGETLSRAYGVNNVDPTRLAAQVVSGIGFLCAGTIIKDGVTVRGLTTAGSLWCVSCIGLAVGAGNYVPAVTSTVLLLVVLRILRTLTHAQMRTRNRLSARVTFTPRNGALSNLTQRLAEAGFGVENMRFSSDETKDSRAAVLEIVMPNNTTQTALIAALSDIPDVREAEIMEE